MPYHGQIDSDTNKIFCSYWMTFEEWDDIHDYTIGLIESNGEIETPSDDRKEDNIEERKV